MVYSRYLVGDLWRGCLLDTLWKSGQHLLRLLGLTSYKQRTCLANHTIYSQTHTEPQDYTDFHKISVLIS